MVNRELCSATAVLSSGIREKIQLTRAGAIPQSFVYIPGSQLHQGTIARVPSKEVSNLYAALPPSKLGNTSCSKPPLVLEQPQ
jgi:hypothetical protein